jgi:hypothetical protein
VKTKAIKLISRLFFSSQQMQMPSVPAFFFGGRPTTSSYRCRGFGFIEFGLRQCCLLPHHLKL